MNIGRSKSLMTTVTEIRIEHPLLVRLATVAIRIAPAVFLACELVVLAEALAFCVAVGLGFFGVATVPENFFRRLAHGGPNLIAITVLRGVSVLLVISATYSGAWCCRTIASSVRADRPLANLAAASAFAFFVGLIDWALLSVGTAHLLWCAAGWTAVAALWVWFAAAPKLRRVDGRKQ